LSDTKWGSPSVKFFDFWDSPSRFFSANNGLPAAAYFFAETCLGGVGGTWV